MRTSNPAKVPAERRCECQDRITRKGYWREKLPGSGAGNGDGDCCADCAGCCVCCGCAPCWASVWSGGGAVVRLRTIFFGFGGGVVACVPSSCEAAAASPSGSAP